MTRTACRIAAQPAAVNSGLCTPILPMRSPAIIEGKSLAYLASLPKGLGHYELGAIGHGPAGAELAKRLCDQIQGWDHDRATQPRIDAYPTSIAVDGPIAANRVIVNKPESRLIFPT